MDFMQPDEVSLLPMDNDSSSAGIDFDYSVFLQGQQQQQHHNQDTDYLAEEDTNSNTSTNTPPSAFPLQTPLTSQQRQTAAPCTAIVPRATDGGGTNNYSSSSPTQLHHRQRMERRGHTKSRRGCYNCKRRRIKCQETRPECGHCVKTGLKCEYPTTLPQIVHQPQHQIPLFSMQDMRFFQHFLFQCYPHHPIGSENIWTHEIPCLSQKYEYLMHAILGYAASELISSDASLAAPALAHRLKAIRAIKRTLADAANPSIVTNTFEEGNALMATCFALTFQSVLLDDGMVEYMTFIRGIIVVAIQMYHRGASFLFGDFMGRDQQAEILQPHMEKLPLIERSWTDGAVGAIQGLAPLCAHDEVLTTYHDMILEMAKQLYVSSWGAYRAMTAHYGWWMMMPHEDFQRLVDPDNQVAVLLATHWIALKQIMATITETEEKGAAKVPDSSSSSSGSRPEHSIELGIIRWLKYLNRLVDQDHVRYNQWPVWVETQLDLDRGFFGKTH
ncbi:hypothetical protein B0H63DRAFT_470694 [Podospora didyma]|uniref:Zn(2)-C6 fungal-type domain-containing protein n=1 Tax=Podospora didyma TaxID=330526 RepID=A0AAE0NU56_9PEZI|nr:hypothetical protein B0H63DRAFT_470694 [Podospora didyma]